MKQRILLLAVNIMTLYLLSGISATVMVQAQAGSCADISGEWYADESVKATCSLRGEKETYTEKGGGFITIKQSGCKVSYVVPQINVSRRGTVDKNSLSLTGKFVIFVKGAGVNVSKNKVNIKGAIKSGSLIKLNGEGRATGEYQGSTVSCTGTSKAIFTRNAADLVAKDVVLSNTTPVPNLSFDISATVKNRGTITSSGTKLYFYRSKDSKIDKNDVKLVTDEGVADIPALLPGGDLRVSRSVSIGSTGTFWVGACAKLVYGELASSAKNCSAGIKVIVKELDFSITPIMQPLLGVDE